MSDVYVVLLKRGPGEVSAVFSTAALALDYINNSPPCNMQVSCCTVDSLVGRVIDDPVMSAPPTLDIPGVTP